MSDQRERPPSRNCVPAILWFVALGALTGAWPSFSLADEPGQNAKPASQTAKHKQAPTLFLEPSGFVTGSLVDCDQPGRIRWQGRAFARPFEFRLDRLGAIHYPETNPPSTPSGEFHFQLAGGGSVYGDLVALDDAFVELKLQDLGILRLPRTELLRVDRWSGKRELLYLGPGQPDQWVRQPRDNAAAWQGVAGGLVTEVRGATLYKDLALPPRAALQVSLAWKGKPDFVLSLGVNEDEATIATAFRFEVWEKDLVIQRETDEADLASVAQLEEGNGRIQLWIYLDQEQGRIQVNSSTGQPLANLTLAEKTPRVLPGIHLKNQGGELRLDRLEVLNWDGKTVRGVLPDGPSLKRVDGTTLTASNVRFDSEAKAFVLKPPTGDDQPEEEDEEKQESEIRVPAEELSQLSLSNANDAPEQPVVALLQDGSRLFGSIQKIEKSAVDFLISGAREPLSIPIPRFRTLLFVHRTQGEADLDWTPQLELDGVELPGKLVEADREGAESASVLGWHPMGSETASPILEGQSGRIQLQKPKDAKNAGDLTKSNDPNQRIAAARLQAEAARVRLNAQVAAAARAQAGLGPANANAPRQQNGFQRFFLGVAGQPASAGPGRVIPATVDAVEDRRAIFLKTGDMILAEVVRINEQGVTVRRSQGQGKEVVVPHEQIKAAELSRAPVQPIALNKEKRERLLTLPRQQKGNPPTHLIRSTRGDYLRGRIVGMDDQNLQLEVRLEVRTIPRDRVARIIWLHPDTPSAAEDPGPAKGEKGDPGRSDDSGDRARPLNPRLIQVVRDDGSRLTFIPEHVNEKMVEGKSLVIGGCEAQLDQVDRILLGRQIQSDVSQVVFQNWVLTDAREPSIDSEEDEEGGGSADGKASPLVGKPAPDFALETLDGKTFRLSESKGKVVVLDFWASWCGPCMQAMPQVEHAVSGFREQGVELVAVNLQETASKINPTLERLKLKVRVALDKDGDVAGQYKASAIPQTVVIDRQGQIHRLFVGGGARLGDSLRDAIQTALDLPETGATAPETPKVKVQGTD